MKGKINKSFRI